MGRLLAGLGKLDPLGALAASAKEKRALAGDIKGKVFQSWGALNPAAAADWLNQNTSTPGYDDAFLGFVAGYAKRDLTQATDAILKTLQPNDPLFGPSMQRLSSHASAQGGARAVQDWFRSVITSTQGDPQTVAQASRSAAVRLSDISLPDAAAFVGEQASKPWRSDAAIGFMSYRYSQSDPASDAAWVASLPPVKGAYVGVTELVGNWSHSDPAALQQWMETQQGPIFKQAVKEYLQVIGDNSPEISAYWKQRLATTVK